MSIKLAASMLYCKHHKEVRTKTYLTDSDSG